MKKCTATGVMETFLQFSSVDQVKIEIESGASLSLPKKINKGNEHQFELIFSHAGANESAKASELTNLCANYLCVKYNVPVVVAKIERVVCRQLSHSTNVISVPAGYTVGTPVIGPLTVDISKTCLETKYLWKAFSEAVSSRNKTEEFWKLYMIASQICGKSKPCKSSIRLEIDKFFQKELATPSEIWHNDHDGKERSVITCLRDEFSHPGGTFNSGLPIDNLDDEISKIIDKMRSTVRLKIVASK